MLHDKGLRDFEGKVLIVDAFPSPPRLCVPWRPCGNAHDTDEEKTKPIHAARVASAGAGLCAMAEQLWGLLRHAAVLLMRRPSACILTHQYRGM
jgi:hypothetical protein